MKLKLSYAYNTTEQSRRYDVSDAIERSLAAGSSRGGIAEHAAAHADACACMLGRVVQMLHDKGVLSEDNVLELVVGFVKAES